MNWPGWLISALRFLLGLLGAGEKAAGRELGRAEADVENLETQADRVAAANEARRAVERDIAAGRVPDDDPYRTD